MAPEMIDGLAWRAKPDGEKTVPLFPCLGGKVPLSGPESGELKSKVTEAGEDLTGKGTSQKCLQVETQDGVPLFLSPEQLAELAGISPRAVRKAVTEGRLRALVSTADAGHHKGRLVYAISQADGFSFYPKAKTVWDDQQRLNAAAAAAKAIQPPSNPDAISGMKDWQRKRMDARLGLLRYVDALISETGLSRERAINRLVADADANRLPDEIRQLLPLANARSGQSGDRTLSRRTLQRWAAEAKQGMDHLAPRAFERPMPSWLPLLLSLYRQPQKPSLSHCVQQLGALLPEGQKAPSYDSARRAMDKVGAVEREKGRMLPREIKTIKPFRRREKPAFPMDVLTMDGHTFDAEIAHPEHGRPFRPEVTICVDVATSRILGWSAWEKENTWSVMDSLCMAIVAGGEPCLILYTDNGSGYKNDRMAQVASRLGIKHHFGIPYNSQARGVVEHLQKTVWIDLGAKAFSTYVGASMDRQARQIVFKASRQGQPVLPSWSTFVAFIDLVIEAYNSRRSKACPKVLDSETGRQRYLSPTATWQRAEALGWAPEGLAVSLDDFRPQELRKVARGEVSLFGNVYFSQELKELHGEQVNVTFDIHNAKHVWIYRQDGTFVCQAGFEANKTDYFPKPYVEALREQRKDGQRKRLAAKQERVLGEPLEPVEIREITAETLEASEAQMRKLGVLDMAPQASSQAAPSPIHQPSASDVPERMRPAFKDDREWALWVLDHPDLADPEEVQEVMLRLKNDQFFRIRLDRDANGHSGCA